MRNKYIFASIPLFLGAFCFILFSMIGSEVAPDGTLKEPFFLIPIGYVFLFSGVISLFVVAIKKSKQ
ncbi:DUF3955 domain-containing protein [Bacillus manliponensis]|uniref:DUF3955 domain-containing protein n=1 Tax=Bacillus manliponensis TaxID=574376 RepID=UPI003517B0BC